MPVFLILYDATMKVAYWLYVQHDFESTPSRKPGMSARSVQVLLPTVNVVDPAFVTYAQDRKIDVLNQLSKKIVHHGQGNTSHLPTTEGCPKGNALPEGPESLRQGVHCSCPTRIGDPHHPPSPPRIVPNASESSQYGQAASS